MKKICPVLSLLALFIFFTGCSAVNPKAISNINTPAVSSNDTPVEKTSQANDNISKDGASSVLMGNTNGNIMNEGFYAKAGQWVYAGLSGGLYKYKADGSGFTKICDDKAKYINVSGDLIYYVNISDRSLNKIKTDGTGKVKLEDGAISAVVVCGDWIYYGQSPTGVQFQLYRMKTNGSEKYRLSEDIIGDVDEAYINVYDGCIYYWSGSSSDFHRITADGTTVSQNSYSFYSADIEDGWIYYAKGTDNRKLYKTKLSTGESIKICDDEVCLPVNTYNGWIYYFKDMGNDNCRLYKIKTDGTGRMELTDDEFPISFGRRNGVTVNIAGDSVYVNKYVADNALQRIKIKTDGTEKQVISTDDIPAIYKKIDESRRAELEKIAKQTIIDMLEKNKSVDIPERQRIKDYKINNIKALNGDITYFGFSVDYSVQGVIEETDWVAGNGEVGKDGWVLNKLQFCTLKKEGSSYIIESMGTSPTFSMIESDAMK